MASQEAMNENDTIEQSFRGAPRYGKYEYFFSGSIGTIDHKAHYKVIWVEHSICIQGGWAMKIQPGSQNNTYNARRVD